MTKTAKIDTIFMTKTAENHILWGRSYLYSPYTEVSPPVPRLLTSLVKFPVLLTPSILTCTYCTVSTPGIDRIVVDYFG